MYGRQYFYRKVGRNSYAAFELRHTRGRYTRSSFRIGQGTPNCCAGTGTHAVRHHYRGRMFFDGNGGRSNPGGSTGSPPYWLRTAWTNHPETDREFPRVDTSDRHSDLSVNP